MRPDGPGERRIRIPQYASVQRCRRAARLRAAPTTPEEGGPSSWHHQPRPRERCRELSPGCKGQQPTRASIPSTSSLSMASARYAASRRRSARCSDGHASDLRRIVMIRTGCECCNEHYTLDQSFRFREASASGGIKVLSQLFHLRCHIGISADPVGRVLTFQDPDLVIRL